MKNQGQARRTLTAIDRLVAAVLSLATAGWTLAVVAQAFGGVSAGRGACLYRIG